jgi:hypothetical protein
MDAQEYVLNFLRARGEIPGATVDEYLGCEYLDVGLVDSFGLVELILDCEDKFSIRFGPEDMQSVEFRTIGGLVGLINRLVQERNDG